MILRTLRKWVVSTPVNFNVPQRALYDIRDSKSYTIRKLADGNCWMVTSLAYELTANSVAVGSKDDHSEFEFNTGDKCGVDGHCVMSDNTATSKGYYFYSWYAATAGIGDDNVTDDVEGSICPSGFRVPSNYIYNNLKSWGSITNAYGLTTDGENNPSTGQWSILEKFPFDFVRAGAFYSYNPSSSPSQHVYYGVDAKYWSSSAVNNEWAYDLYYGDWRGSHILNPQYQNNKNNGYLIRCVAL